MLCRPSSCHPLLPTPREAVGPWLPIRSSPGLWVVSRGWSWSISGAAPRKLHHSSTPQTPARLTLVWSGGVENVLVQTHVAHTCVHTQTQTHTCTPCTDMRMRGHRHLCAGRGWWPCRVRRGLRAALRCRPCALPSSPSRGSFPMRFWGEGSLQLPLAFPPPPPLLKHRLGRHCLPYTLTVHLLLRGTRRASWNLRGGFPSPSHLCCWALGRGQAGLAQTGGRCVDLPGGRGGRASAAVIGALCKRSSPGTFRSSMWAARAR